MQDDENRDMVKRVRNQTVERSYDDKDEQEESKGQASFASSDLEEPNPDF